MAISPFSRACHRVCFPRLPLMLCLVILPELHNKKRSNIIMPLFSVPNCTIHIIPYTATMWRRDVRDMAWRNVCSVGNAIYNAWFAKLYIYKTSLQAPNFKPSCFCLISWECLCNSNKSYGICRKIKCWAIPINKTATYILICTPSPTNYYNRVYNTPFCHPVLQ